MQSKNKIVSIKEDDDYFEEFDQENWENENKFGLKNNDWDNNWEDQIIDENLEKQIKCEIEKYKNKIQINN